jgi:hypothetical protein
MVTAPFTFCGADELACCRQDARSLVAGDRSG